MSEQCGGVDPLFTLMIAREKGGGANWELEELLQLQAMDKQMRLDDVDAEAYSDYSSEPGPKKYAKMILPHVGLVLLTIAYVVLGAVVFYKVENQHERRVKRSTLERIHEEKLRYLSLLWNLTMTKPSYEDFSSYGLEEISNLTDLIYSAVVDDYLTDVEIRANNITQAIWSFTSSVFFSVTVVTTIGYGNPVPHSMQGKVLTVVFAMVGVPLTLITIADLGKFLSEHLIWLYSKYLTTKYRLKQYLRGDTPYACNDENDDICEYCRFQNNLLELQQERRIPAILLMVILISYTALGGCLMSELEGWQFVNSFYFSFVTMTTIGFGDYVPSKKDSTIYLALVYIILGLAITTMCIDLVGVQYIHKIHYFGRRIQNAQQALAIVGGKAVYLSDLLHRSRFGSRKYKDRIDALIIENLLLSGRLAFTPSDIKRIRYIDEGTDSIPSSTASISTASCKLCRSQSSLNRTPIPHIDASQDSVTTPRQMKTV